MSALNDDNSKPIALALETATSRGAVAIGRGDVVVQSHTFGGALTHAANLLPTIAAMCEDIGVTPDEVSTVYVSAGPGSFTGLRVGITAARMLAMALGARTVAVPTLSVIAANALTLDPPPERLAVVLNSRRHRAYAGVFSLQRSRLSDSEPRTSVRADLPAIERVRPESTRRFETDSALSQSKYAPTDPPQEVDAAQFIRTHGATVAYLGDATGTYADVLSEVGGRKLPDQFHHPRAEIVYRLGNDLAAAGQFTPARDLVPCYVSRPDAEVQWSAAPARKS